MTTLQPLRGLTFLNTREAGDAPLLTAKLEDLGGRVYEQPAIRFLPMEDWHPFDTRLGELTPADWVVFTSANGVRFALARVIQLDGQRGGRLLGVLSAASIAAVGKGTENILTTLGLNPRVVPKHYQAENLLHDLLKTVPPQARVWVLRADGGRTVVEDGLKEAGYPVVATSLYRTGIPPEGIRPEAQAALENNWVDWVVFTSPSTVHNLLAMLPPGLVQSLKKGRPLAACLGEVTAGAAREAGLTVALVPSQQDLDGLVEALADHAARQN
ncbi:MAG: uroporphyrinogen-III synthase [Deltaproteobacteria bacterium]|nr:uroporphyrinogen-III synthase [Deltaproteobacteria bacterium]